jgi:hypothetical protein
MVSLFEALFGVVGVGLIVVGALDLRTWRTMRSIDPGERGVKEWFLGDPFVVSDSGEEQAEGRQLKRGLFVMAIGMVFIGFVLFAVLGDLGSRPAGR